MMSYCSSLLENLYFYLNCFGLQILFIIQDNYYCGYLGILFKGFLRDGKLSAYV